MREVQLTKGYVAFVDDDDYERINSFRWHYCNGYARRRDGRGYRMMACEVLQVPNGTLLDHANRNKLDNTKANLRHATWSQNMMNKDYAYIGEHGYRGVSRDKRRPRFIARMKHDGRYLFIGTYDTAVLAAAAYNLTAKELRGEFAVLNDVPDEAYAILAQIGGLTK